MEEKEEALRLIKISFDKIVKVTDYKGDDKLFKQIQDIAKQIALDFLTEIEPTQEDYWDKVKNHIKSM